MPVPAPWTSSAARSGVRVFFRPLYAPRCLARDALTLAFPDQGTLEFREGAHDRKHEVGHGGVLSGPRGVPARSLVSEDPVQDLALKLAKLILVQRTNPNVTDTLTRHRGLQSLTL